MSISTFKSKNGIVRKNHCEFYMLFCDLSNFTSMLPEDKKDMITADYDTIQGRYNGLSLGAKISVRQPYSRIELVDYNSPVAFHVVLHFDEAGSDTEFSIEVEAELNFMMKMMIGSKMQQALDAIVDSLVAFSEGRMPEGFDASKMPEGFDLSKFGGNR